jgi:hypothetical protein
MQITFPNYYADYLGEDIHHCFIGSLELGLIEDETYCWVEDYNPKVLNVLGPSTYEFNPLESFEVYIQGIYGTRVASSDA